MNDFKITSIDFSENYKICHRDIVSKIKKISIISDDIKEQFCEVVFKTSKNKPFVGYNMTRYGEFYLLTSINQNGKAAKELFEKKRLLIKAYLLMEEQTDVENLAKALCVKSIESKEETK